MKKPKPKRKPKITAMNKAIESAPENKEGAALPHLPRTSAPPAKEEEEKPDETS